MHFLDASDSRLIEELDEIVVRPEARHSPDKQDAWFRPLGGNDSSQRLQTHRKTFKEGWILLQTLPSSRQVLMGHEG